MESSGNDSPSKRLPHSTATNKSICTPHRRLPRSSSDEELYRKPKKRKTASSDMDEVNNLRVENVWLWNEVNNVQDQMEKLKKQNFLSYNPYQPPIPQVPLPHAVVQPEELPWAEPDPDTDSAPLRSHYIPSDLDFIVSQPLNNYLPNDNEASTSAMAPQQDDNQPE